MAPRRTARKATKRKRTPESDYSSEDEEYLDPKPVAKQAKSVAKQPTRRARGKLGALAKLPSMPLDVVYEIFSSLEPMDLLNLARTSKDFRQLLMNRDSAHVWRTVLENADNLPDCPADMSPPAFVNLLHCSFCHKCGKGPCEKIYWDCRARYCNNCKNWMYREARYKTSYASEILVSHATKADNIPSPLNLLPIYALVPLVREGNVRHKVDNIYLQKDIVLHRPSLKALKEKLSQLNDEAEIVTYITAAVRKLEIAREQTRDLTEWYEDKEQFRIQNNERLRRERLESIIDKLTSLGYGRFISEIVDARFRNHPLVSQSKALTDRIWNNIEATIVGFAEPVKRTALKQEMDERVSRRIRILDEAIFEIKPRGRNDLSLRDIALYMPSVKELLSDPDVEEPTIADFEFLRTTLPEYEETWRSDARQYLCDLANKSLGFDAEDPFVLAAGSVFTCDFCNRSCSWPNILAHTCKKRAADLEQNPDFFTRIVIKEVPALTWRPTGYTLHADTAKAIVEAHGLSAMTVGPEEMDESPTRMTCLKHSAKHRVSIMNWRAMLQHAVSNKCSIDDWKVIDDAAQIEAAKPLEEIVRANNLEPYSQHWNNYGYSWRCARCPTIEANETGGGHLAWHLLQQHQIEKPSAEDYVYAAPISVNGTVTVDLLDEKMKDDRVVSRMKTDTAAYYPLT